MMTNQDKETIGLMIKDYIHPLDKKVDQVLEKLESITEEQSKQKETQKMLMNETSMWRWMQRKPKRFGIILILFWILSLDAVQTEIVEKLKVLGSLLNLV